MIYPAIYCIGLATLTIWAIAIKNAEEGDWYDN